MPQILMPYTVQMDNTLRVTPISTLFAMGDSNAHRFELKIMRAGVQEDLSGCKVLCKFYRISESTLISIDGSVEDSKAVAVLEKACYEYIGRFVIAISIKNGDDETTVFYGDGYMQGRRADTAITGEYIVYDVETLISKISEIDAATASAKTATENANAATESANTAASNAQKKAVLADTAAKGASGWANATITATDLPTGSAPTAGIATAADGHKIITLGIPRGNTGATPQISVEVSTGAAGSEASVSVSGTAENPVIHLTIPRGSTGAIENLTINGKPVESGEITLTASDVGALPSGGTAVNSGKLGGKAPEYYIQPRNLLDNSDFRNPVNQRGQKSYTGGYGIDRWKQWNSSSTTYVRDGYITVSIIQQYIGVPIDFDTVYTLAAKKTDGTILCLAGTFDTKDNRGGLRLDYDTNTDGSKKPYVSINAAGDYLWVALYEGSYTAETLPPYVPKGYEEELFNCRYYFQKHTFAQYQTICTSFQGHAYCFLNFQLYRGMRGFAEVTQTGGAITVGTRTYTFSGQHEATRCIMMIGQNYEEINNNVGSTYSYTLDAAGVCLDISSDL